MVMTMMVGKMQKQYGQRESESGCMRWTAQNEDNEADDVMCDSSRSNEKRVRHVRTDAKVEWLGTHGNDSDGVGIMSSMS